MPGGRICLSIALFSALAATFARADEDKPITLNLNDLVGLHGGPKMVQKATEVVKQKYVGKRVQVTPIALGRLEQDPRSKKFILHTTVEVDEQKVPIKVSTTEKPEGI